MGQDVLDVLKGWVMSGGPEDLLLALLLCGIPLAWERLAYAYEELPVRPGTRACTPACRLS